MPSVTWAMAAASPSTAWAITPISWLDLVTSSRVLCRVWDTSPTMRRPRSVAPTELSMSSLVALAASSDLLATTEKPLPAEPARAASTAAFSARMLVWKAMFSMVAMILLISWETLTMSSMAETICPICSSLRLTCSPVRRALAWAEAALFTFSSAVLLRSSRVAKSSSTALACSVAPWARDWAPEESCSALPDTRRSAWLIWAKEEEMVVVKLLMDSSMERKSPM